MKKMDGPGTIGRQKQKTEGRRPENTRTSDGSHAPRSRISGIPAGGTNGVRAGSDGEEPPPVVS